MSVLRTFNFYEWIELRDLFGIDGRATGILNGIRTFMPYWENLTQWASIPQCNEQKVAELCKYFNARLLAKLKKQKKI